MTTKGRIRHVALSVKDPWETAEFYKQALGLEEELESARAGLCAVHRDSERRDGRVCRTS